MQLKQELLTKNDCYKAGRTITVKGIMVHSTATPGAMAETFARTWNAPGIDKAVHAFVDDSGVIQTLNWNCRGWHAGSGTKGSANNTHVAFEICEPAGFKYVNGAMVGYDVAKNEPYFKKAYQNAVDLCVMFCKMFKLTEKDIIDHEEGCKLGIATNHSDVMHWFPKHGKSMDTLRADVRKALGNEDVETNIVERIDSMDTKDLQAFLNTLGVVNDIDHKPLVVDGQDGPKTQSAKAKAKALLQTVLK